jgi:hypothetical protein
MRQKRVQGSHFAHLKQASEANKLVVARRIDPCMSEVYSWADIPKAHMRMWKNEHRPGNMAVLHRGRGYGRSRMPSRRRTAARTPTVSSSLCNLSSSGLTRGPTRLAAGRNANGSPGQARG